MDYIYIVYSIWLAWINLNERLINLLIKTITLWLSDNVKSCVWNHKFTAFVFQSELVKKNQTAQEARPFKEVSGRGR